MSARRNIDISPYFMTLYDALYEVTRTPNLFNHEIAEASHHLAAPYTDVESLIDAVQRATRIMTIHHGGLMADETFAKAYDAQEFPLWSSHAPLEADIDLQQQLGDRLYNIPAVQPNTRASIVIGNGSQHIVEHIIAKLYNSYIPIHFDIADESFNRLAINHMTKGAMAQYAEFKITEVSDITNRMVAVPSAEPPCPIEADKEKHKLYAELIKPIKARVLSGEIMSTLTFFPTEQDAENDGIPFDEYIKLFFELCDQPDAQIEQANEFLIDKLHKASTIRFTNKDGTDVSGSLLHEDGRHFLFANSQTRRNVPGSEVFSGIGRDSINGTVVSKGVFLSVLDDSKKVINLTRHFTDGVMTHFSAEQGAEHFQEFLDQHPDHARVGELGIGTNPHLKRHVANGLLVEKISSSFHFAHGQAYTMTNYLGTPVLMDNGNRGTKHWDITTMLGDIYLDDELIMKDGEFLAPELDVLNRGWNAVPVEERPDRWKNYAGPYTGPA